MAQNPEQNERILMTGRQSDVTDTHFPAGNSPSFFHDGAQAPRTEPGFLTARAGSLLKPVTRDQQPRLLQATSGRLLATLGHGAPV